MCWWARHLGIKPNCFFLNILLSLLSRHKIRFMERDSEHDAVLNHILLAYEFHTWDQRRLNIKGALSNLRYFLATKSPLKLIRNAFYFNLKFRNLWCHNLVNKQLQYTYIDQYLKKKKNNQAMKFGQLIEHNMRNIFFFLKNHMQNAM